MRSKFAKGVLFTLAGASLWGFSGGAAQYLLTNYATSPLFLTAVRLPCAAVIYFLFVHVQRPGVVRAMFRDAETLRGLVLFGIVGLFLSQAAYLMTIDATNAGTATVLQQMSCVITMLYMCLATRRFPRPNGLAALACALTATFFIATGGDPGQMSLPLHGLIWGLITAASMAFYLIQPLAMMRKHGSIAVIGGGMAMGAVAAVPLFFALRLAGPAIGLDAGWYAVPQLDAFGWLMLAVFVVVGTFAAYALYLHGVSIVGGVVGSLLGCVEPVSASLFALLWLGTPYTWADWVGLALMIACVVFITLPSKKKDAA